VDFTFSPEQQALRDSVREFLTAEASPAFVRAMMDDPRGFTDEGWRAVATLGWPGLLVPDEHGGLGLGLVDLTVVLEEMGAVPFPGPFFSSAVLATIAARRLGATDLLSDLASGARRGTIALEEPGHGDPVERVRSLASNGAGGSLDGTKPFVVDGHTADWVIVAARTDGELASFVLEQPAGDVVPSLDPTRKLARVELTGRPARRIGPGGDHTDLWRRISDDAAIAMCAELVGSAGRAYQLATEYAKVRVQFGRPIATFQAIKHKLAEMLRQLELARVATHYAAWASDAEAPDRAAAAAMCKSFVAEAANFISAESIQIHGGVGFTWQCDAHLHYRRAKQADLLMGSQGWQRQRLADIVLGA
jgi:alkylation response protein AidB-like acyl-CoA dehydrogenase